SRRRHTRFSRDWSSDVCSSDLKGVSGGSKLRTTGGVGCNGHANLPRVGVPGSPADDRIAGRADDRVAGSAEERVAGSAEERAAGSADERVAGSADGRVAGSSSAVVWRARPPRATSVSLV